MTNDRMDGLITPAIHGTFLTFALFCLALSTVFLTSCATDKTSYPSNDILKSVAKATFEVRLAKDAPAAGFAKTAMDGYDKPLYISNKVEISEADIAGAKAVSWQGKPAIEFELTKAGAEKMRNFTHNHINEKAAMILNGKLTTAPIIRGEISSRGIINGHFTMEQAQNIARGLVGK